MNDAAAILDQYQRNVVREVGLEVAEDIRQTLAEGQMFASSELEYGAARGPALALSPERIKTKTKRGYSRPELPRVATGDMLESVGVRMEDNAALVTAWDQSKAQVQQCGGEGTWLDEYGKAHPPTKARPFLSISNEGAGIIQELTETIGKQCAAALDGLRFEVNVTV